MAHKSNSPKWLKGTGNVAHAVRGLTLGAAFAVAAAASPAFGQEQTQTPTQPAAAETPTQVAAATPPQPAAAAPAEITEVVVTGSRIRTTDQGALPVTTVTSAQIQTTGATNTEQFLQTLSVAVQGNNNTVAATGSGATTGGVSTVSLRGLGSQRTLVLIDSKRVAGGGTITDSTSVDVGMVPLAAVERVDVLKDSASAIYGSDAIAGVINFILRDNFQGLELFANGGGTTDGGGATRLFSATAGFGDLMRDRFNVMVFASWQKDDALFGNDRAFARSGVNVGAGNDVTSGNSFPANFSAFDGSFGTNNPNAPNNCAPSISDPLNHPNTRCRFDPSPYVSLLPSIAKYNLFTSAHYAITDDIQLYGTASYAEHKVTTMIQPVPLSDQFALPSNNVLANQFPYNAGACGPACATILLNPTSPYYPTAFVQGISGGPTPPLDILYRAFSNGMRNQADVSKQPRFTLGVKGTVGGWDFDAGFLYSQTQLSEWVYDGYPAYSKVLPLLNTGTVNFFGANTPAVDQELKATNYYGLAYGTRTTVAEFEASGSHKIMDLPAGPLQVALSASYRKEKFSTTPSQAIESGDISGYGGNFLPQDDQRNVYGASAEFAVPIFEGLSASPAVRYDYYTGTGGKTSPKIGLRWKPMDQLLVRGSFAKGFRAPSLTDLYQPRTLGVSQPGLTDPQRCPTTNSSADCSTQFNATLGGFPGLQPEISTTYTFGVIVSPLPDLSATIDWFSIKLQNTIVFGINGQVLLSNPAYASFVTRGAPTANCPGCPGPVTLLDQTNRNFGETHIQGFDVDLEYKTPKQPWGRFTFSLLGTYFATYQIQTPTGFQNFAGVVSPITNGAGGVIPRWHHYATIMYDYGPYELSVSQNYQSPYTDLPSTITGTTPEVASYSVVDMQFAWTGIDNLRLAVGARNIGNKVPPYSNVGGQNYFQSGYDPGYVDPRGRFIYGQVSYTFPPFNK
jgi:iron complex outermembrane receptor protein